MKKINLLLVSLLLGVATIAQPVVDNAIIPVAVNLNSVLRLNVTSGGNIEFTVNNLTQYEEGINNGGTNDRYNTNFTVASSVGFNVLLYSENTLLTGVDEINGNKMDLENIGYQIECTGTGTVGAAEDYQLESADDDPSIVVALTDDHTHQTITSNGGAGAGDIEKNAFQLRWRLGTQEGGGMAATSLLTQSIAPDRYTTNVFLVLQAQ